MYASTYFVAPREFSITNWEDTDEVTLETTAAITLNTYSGGNFAVSGVNISPADATVLIKLNGTTICEFGVAGRT